MSPPRHTHIEARVGTANPMVADPLVPFTNTQGRLCGSLPDTGETTSTKANHVITCDQPGFLVGSVLTLQRVVGAEWDIAEVAVQSEPKVADEDPLKGRLHALFSA